MEDVCVEEAGVEEAGVEEAGVEEEHPIIAAQNWVPSNFSENQLAKHAITNSVLEYVCRA